MLTGKIIKPCFFLFLHRGEYAVHVFRMRTIQSIKLLYLRVIIANFFSEEVFHCTLSACLLPSRFPVCKMDDQGCNIGKQQDGNNEDQNFILSLLLRHGSIFSISYMVLPAMEKA